MNFAELSYDFLGAGILDIGLLIFIVYLALRNDTLDKAIAHGYHQSCVITTLVILCEMMTEILQTMGGEARYGLILFNLLGFGLSTYLPMFLCKVFDQKHFAYLTWTPVFIFSMILLTTPWTGWIFCVDEYNNYQRGPFYILFILTYGWGFLMVLKSLIEQAKTLRKKNRKLIYGLMIFLVFGTAIQVIEPKFHTSWTIITFALTINYLFLCQMWFEYDTLTQVANRPAFEKAIKMIEGKRPVWIIMVDLDDFKSVNDTYGHQQGDIFLKKMAEMLQLNFQKNGECYRIGGDEFCVICQEIPEETLLHLLEELKMKIEQEKRIDVRITGMSWGTAHYDGDGQESIVDVWKQADHNLYINKKKKKRTVNG